ncbi:MAG: hypothetical protein KAJ19_16440, partial [Gammaproteobacteria bacterium]|nr:hypothetical protein [Gammaproteobacteria bacterium]
MNNRIIYVALTILSVCTSAATAFNYGGGTGEPDDPYLIYDPNHMQAIGANPNDWDKHFRLIADIDLSAYTGTKFNIIGNTTTNFTGTFDANDHTISNFTYTSTVTNYIGLFGYIGTGGEIKGLDLVDVNVNAGGGDDVGALAGFSGGRISNCYATGVVSGNNRVGGLVGHNSGSIYYSSADANVAGPSYVGGLVGYNVGSLLYSSFEGNVSATGDYVGGLTGRNFSNINDCNVICNVSGNDRVGGISGRSGAELLRCNATGNISGIDNVGGIVGYSRYGGTIEDCHFTGIVSGSISVGGMAGFSGEGLIQKSSTDCDVSGYSAVGGFVGFLWQDGNISQSYSKGSVYGAFNIGGFAGYNDGGDIENCYSESACLGGERVAGFIGTNGNDVFSSGQYCRVINCYSTGPVDGNSVIGGFIGINYALPERTMCSYWDVQTSGQAYSGAGKGRTTAQMYSCDTFAGWACDSNCIWTIADSNDYPRLFWEGKPGDFILKPTYGGGSGTLEEPYLIRTADQLNTIGLARYDWDKHFKLMANLNLSEYPNDWFNTIGYYDGSHSHWGNLAFSGVFDGNGHTITGFSLDNLTGSAGLFSYVSGSTSELKNLGLVNPIVNAPITEDAGAMIGLLGEGTVNKCFVSGGIVSGGDRIGGLIGRVLMDDVRISESYSSAEVNGYLAVGGLIGFVNSTGEISNCFASGDVNGDKSVGGLLGLVYDITVRNSYSTGHVTANSYAGGLIGRESYGTTIRDSLWDKDTSGQTTSDGGIGRTTAEMQTEGTFTGQGWDFVGESANGQGDVWRMCIDDVNYPRLNWEFASGGDFVCPDGVNLADFGFFASHWGETNCA